MDNARYFVLPVADRLSVLVISDEPEQVRTAAHSLLLRALDPFGDAKASALAAKCIRSSEIGALSPSLHPVVMLCGVEPLASAARLAASSLA